MGSLAISDRDGSDTASYAGFALAGHLRLAAQHLLDSLADCGLLFRVKLLALKYSDDHRITHVAILSQKK
jgi:hypothetical protein